MADRSGEAERMLSANGVRLDVLETIASLFVLVLALGGCMSAGEKDPVDTSRFAGDDAVHITGSVPVWTAARRACGKPCCMQLDSRTPTPRPYGF